MDHEDSGIVAAGAPSPAPLTAAQRQEVLERTILPLATVLREACVEAGIYMVASIECPVGDLGLIQTTLSHVHTEVCTPALLGAISLLLHGVPGMGNWQSPPPPAVGRLN